MKLQFVLKSHDMLKPLGPTLFLTNHAKKNESPEAKKTHSHKISVLNEGLLQHFTRRDSLNFLKENQY